MKNSVSDRIRLALRANAMWKTCRYSPAEIASELDVSVRRVTGLIELGRKIEWEGERASGLQLGLQGAPL